MFLLRAGGVLLANSCVIDFEKNMHTLCFFELPRSFLGKSYINKDSGKCAAGRAKDNLSLLQ